MLPLDGTGVKAIDWGGTRAELAFILQTLTGASHNQFRPDSVFERPANVFGRRDFLQLSVQWSPFEP